MRKILLSLLFLFPLCLSAQEDDVTFSPTPDVTLPGSTYAETTKGEAIPDNNQNAWKTGDRHFVAYLHHPAGGRFKTAWKLTANNTVNLEVKMTDWTTREVIATNAVVVSKSSKEQEVTLLPLYSTSSTGWYKLEVSFPKSSQKSSITNWSQLLTYKEKSTHKVYNADYLSSPSVHLNNWSTTDSSAPSGSVYDWCYQEVMMPEESNIIGTYCMSLGVLSGYMGIQVNGESNHDILFSIWDNGSTDEDPNLPDYLRSGCVGLGPDCFSVRFGGEGTGASARCYGEKWIPGKWVKFITNARPEKLRVEVDNGDGTTTTKIYSNMIVSAWFCADGVDTDWHYIGTIRQSGGTSLFSGWYSFLENYNYGSGQHLRKSYYRNGYMRTADDGRWIHRNKVGFGHTDGGSEVGKRNDYGQGAMTLDGEEVFYLTSGGYAEKPVQSPNTITLKPSYDQLPAQSDLDRLTAIVDSVLLREQCTAMEEQLSKAARVDASEWVVTKVSDQATNEGAGNVYTALHDENENTYWHSKWSPDVAFPHTVDIKVTGDPISLSSIRLVQQRNQDKYNAKDMTLQVSDDGRTYTDAASVSFPSALSPTVAFDAPVTSSYFRLKFTSNHEGGPFLCIHEIYLTGAPRLADVLAVAAYELSLENQIGGFPTEALAPLRALYADGTCTDVEALKTALMDLVGSSRRLQYDPTRISSLEQVRSDKAYLLYNEHFTTYAISTEAGKLWAAGMSGDSSHKLSNSSYATPVDPLSLYANWMLLKEEGKYYLYNIGAERYLKTPSSGSGACTLVTAKTAIKVTELGDAFAFNTGTSSQCYMCAAPQLSAPINSWSSGDAGSAWQFIENPDVNPLSVLTAMPDPEPDTDVIYDLQGRPLYSVPTTHGIYIVNGRKVVF